MTPTATRLFSLAVLATASLALFCRAGVPAPEQFFHNQLVDHINPDDGPYGGKQWSHRYYTFEDFFKGPGHPIFVIMGGEGHISPSTGLYYPFVTHHLAKIFGAYVLEPEHRFYGESQPLGKSTDVEEEENLVLMNRDEDPRVKLFTSEQALHDYMHLLTHIQGKLGCSIDKFSKDYCPVITVGGSYPGFLSAMARVVFPHLVDMAYAASAPMTFYSQQVGQYDYYNHITKVADGLIDGCADGVRSSLLDVKEHILKGDMNETIMGICEGTIPNYISTSTPEGLAMLVDEVMMVVGYTFANDNMGNYPPSNTTRLYKACETFTSSTLDSFGKFRQFLNGRLPGGDDCWNMTAQLPTGPGATITSGDWSGVGTGTDGESWDFQTCTLEVEAIGFSEESMFPPRDWSMDWLESHCQKRFGVTPLPYDLVRRWKFDDLVGAHVTRIVFTNGLKDGWSVGGIQTNISDSLLALNFPNGAHHSDLSGMGPSDEDSEDIKAGFKSIIEILGGWLDEMRPSEL